MGIWERVLGGISGLCLLAVAFYIGVFVPAALQVGPDQSNLTIPLMGVSAGAATLCVITAIRQLKRPRPGYMIASTVFIIAFSMGLALMLHGMIGMVERVGTLSNDYLLSMRADTNSALIFGLCSLGALLVLPLLRNFAIPFLSNISRSPRPS
jgi:hypothetical protein